MRQHQRFLRCWIKRLLMSVCFGSLLGCHSLSLDRASRDQPTMSSLYQTHQGSMDGGFSEQPSEVVAAIEALHLPVDEQRIQGVTNPLIDLYIYPHRVGEAGLPIPGYTTHFPLYTRTPVMVASKENAPWD